jgi:hypothetical protein
MLFERQQIKCRAILYNRKKLTSNKTHISPSQEEFQENGKIGDAVHVSFQTQD